MPLYRGLDPATDPAAARTMDRILELRQAFTDQALPQRTLDETLLLATWNLREFDSGKYGARLPESYYYIAEIISRFDMVAIEEVNRNLFAFKQLMWLLGPDWKFLVTDVTAGTSGNNERTAIVYDARTVQFEGLAGELVIPTRPRVRQPARSPLLAGFRVGWAVFSVAVVHLLWGKARPSLPERVAEVDNIARLLKSTAIKAAEARHEAEREGTGWEDRWAENVILLGDFNVFGPEDETLRRLKKHGFQVPVHLESVKFSNAARTRPYDQIALRTRADRFGKVLAGGAFDWTTAVFRDDDEKLYRSAMGTPYRSKKTADDKRAYYSEWRTHQISDHLPLWVELQVDYYVEYLQRRLREG